MRWWWTGAACLMLAGGCDIGSDERAPSARAPGHAERESIVRALPASQRNIPVECIRLDIAVSQDANYARLGFEFLNATRPGSRCIRYAFNGFAILQKTDRWRIVYNGSTDPSCSMNIPPELVGCTRR